MQHPPVGELCGCRRDFTLIVSRKARLPDGIGAEVRVLNLAEHLIANFGGPPNDAPRSGGREECDEPHFPSVAVKARAEPFQIFRVKSG